MDAVAQRMQSVSGCVLVRCDVCVLPISYAAQIAELTLLLRRRARLLRVLGDLKRVTRASISTRGNLAAAEMTTTTPPHFDNDTVQLYGEKEEEAWSFT